ncbi:ABC transporter permease subunit [Streptomyces sp. NPDC005576]|uniref:ABC transporter permease subunit n=1 Tax=unclassified Streptomyces TaxID=2593676 RepID=UPI0034115549
MSTLAPPRPAVRASAGLRGPARLVVRQHRRAFQLLILLTVLAVAGLVAVALWVGHDADAFARTGCRVGDQSPTHACAQSVRNYLDSQLRLSHARSQVGLLTVLLPAVYGAFMAGPAIGRELESGTHRLAWTQSVSPARWLTAKLAVPATAVVAVTLVLTAARAWASGQAEQYTDEWYMDGLRSTGGVLPLAYALFALAVGTLVGLLLRSTLRSIAVAVVVQGIAMYGFNAVRVHLWPVGTATYHSYGIGAFHLDRWVVDTGYLTSTGERLPLDTCIDSGDTCLNALGVTGRYVDYHPESHHWPLQLVETGILLAVAALAVYASYRLLHRLHG